jgi:CRISPR/Cas system-associated exonuclease Cas4 (RecB family)
MKQRHGIGTPSSPPFLLNSAVDGLLKTEFEHYRQQQIPHPIFEEYKLNFVPLKNTYDKWRSLKYEDKDHNMVLTGILDDLWLDQETNKIILADYKATSTQKDINIFFTYKWQMDFYFWLLKKTGMDMSSDSYFVYANADRYKERFDCTMHFNMSLKKYEVDDSWVEQTLDKIRSTLDDDVAPSPFPECKNCNYAEQVSNIERKGQTVI